MHGVSPITLIAFFFFGIRAGVMELQGDGLVALGAVHRLAKVGGRQAGSSGERIGEPDSASFLVVVGERGKAPFFLYIRQHGFVPLFL